MNVGVLSHARLYKVKGWMESMLTATRNPEVKVITGIKSVIGMTLKIKNQKDLDKPSDTVGMSFFTLSVFLHVDYNKFIRENQKRRADFFKWKGKVSV